MKREFVKTLDGGDEVWMLSGDQGEPIRLPKGTKCWGTRGKEGELEDALVQVSNWWCHCEGDTFSVGFQLLCRVPAGYFQRTEQATVHLGKRGGWDYYQVTGPADAVPVAPAGSEWSWCFADHAEGPEDVMRLMEDHDCERIREPVEAEFERDSVIYRVPSDAPAPPVTRTRTDTKPRGRKPPLQYLMRAPLVWAARAFQFGAVAKGYGVGNFLLPPDDGNHLERHGEYLRAGLSHVTAATDQLNRVLGGLADAPALLAPDPESGLPEICHALATLMMGVQQMIDAGYFPEDPGTPWVKEGA